MNIIVIFGVTIFLLIIVLLLSLRSRYYIERAYFDILDIFEMSDRRGLSIDEVKFLYKMKHPFVFLSDRLVVHNIALIDYRIGLKRVVVCDVIYFIYS